MKKLLKKKTTVKIKVSLYMGEGGGNQCCSGYQCCKP
jgi:hypothetical protein